jgi:hypothetical protein
MPLVTETYELNGGSATRACAKCLVGAGEKWVGSEPDYSINPSPEFLAMVCRVSSRSLSTSAHSRPPESRAG